MVLDQRKRKGAGLCPSLMVILVTTMLGDGVYEARFFIGPGYRVYFAIHKGEIILLLTGGDKSTQAKDVRKAKEFFKSYLEVRNANKKS